MSYTVLARRYRSQSFDEVVGQEAIARTLQNAIEQDRVAHAYLFVGTRGVGKTSMARLLAKALNGASPEVDQAIMAGRDTDVIEIDAASNRGVDEARDLIANCVYRPMRGPHKIYIIDEVHMLTREAFNALLKTMEEPPSHVKFILCTTEPHKVPPTIQSRCQRFEFRNISTEAIADHLSGVIESEGMRAEPELTRILARMASGSMRDGLSLLDRVMASTPAGEAMTVQMLEALLGLPARDMLLALLEKFADQDARGALEQAAELLNQGVSLEQVIVSIIESLRDLMVLSACGSETDLVDLAGDARRAAAALADRFTAAGLVHMIALSESVARLAKSSANPRALFDALIVRLAMTEHIADVAALLKEGAGASAPSRRAMSTRPTQKKSADRHPLERDPSAMGKPSVEEASQPSSPPAVERASRPSSHPTVERASRPSRDAPSSEETESDDWRRVCQAAEARPTTRVLIQSLRLVTIERDRAVLTADDPRMLAHARTQVELLASLFERALGRPVRVELTADESVPGEQPAAPAADRPNLSNDPILENAVVRQAMALFDARVVAIEKGEPEPPPELHDA